jgi:hypothetical protein
MERENKMEVNMNEDENVIKNGEEFSRRERIFVGAIFSEVFLEFFEKTAKELREENIQKNTEIYTNLVRELEESIQHFEEEHIDVRVQTMVFVKALVRVVMDSTSIVLRNK